MSLPALGALFIASACSGESTGAQTFSADSSTSETPAKGELAATQEITDEGPALEDSGMNETGGDDETDGDNGTGGDTGVANLPYSRGKVFTSLDEYLAHLEKNSAIDLPYWKQIKPGVYEFVIRMPGAEREIATRDELMERYGFTH